MTALAIIVMLLLVLSGAALMRVVTDPDAVAKYQAALAELELLEDIPKGERDEEAYRAALLAVRDAFMAVTQS